MVSCVCPQLGWEQWWQDWPTAPTSPTGVSSPSLGSLVGWEGDGMGLLVSLQHRVPMGFGVLSPCLASHPHSSRHEPLCLSFPFRRSGIMMEVQSLVGEWLYFG